MPKSGVRLLVLEFVDYFWPRVFIFTVLYWIAVVTGMFDFAKEFKDVINLRALAIWMTQLTSLRSILIFLVVSGFFCLLEFVFRVILARRGKVRHWIFVRANRLSVVGLEIFLGLLSVTSVLLLNIMFHLAVLGEEGVLKPQDDNLQYDLVRNACFALAILIVLFMYKQFVIGRENKLTRRFKARKN